MPETLMVNNTITPSSKLDFHYNGIVLTKDISGWEIGNAGGLDIGSVAVGTSYHCHQIVRKSDGFLDVLLSAAPLSPVVPPGWQLTGLIYGAAIYGADGATQSFWQFIQKGNVFVWKNGWTVVELASAPNSGGPYLRTLKGVPMGVPVEWSGLMNFVTTGDAWGILTDPDMGVPTINPSNSVVNVPPGGNQQASLQCRMTTSASRQLYTGTYLGASWAALTMITQSYRDFRVNRNAA